MPTLPLREVQARIGRALPGGEAVLSDPQRPVVIVAGVGNGPRSALHSDADVAELVDRYGGALGDVDFEVRSVFPEPGSSEPCVVSLPIASLCRPGSAARKHSSTPRRSMRPVSAGKMSARAAPPPSCGGGVSMGKWCQRPWPQPTPRKKTGELQQHQQQHMQQGSADSDAGTQDTPLTPPCFGDSPTRMPAELSPVSPKSARSAVSSRSGESPQKTRLPPAPGQQQDDKRAVPVHPCLAEVPAVSSTTLAVTSASKRVGIRETSESPPPPKPSLRTFKTQPDPPSQVAAATAATAMVQAQSPQRSLLYQAPVVPKETALDILKSPTSLSSPSSPLAPQQQQLQSQQQTLLPVRRRIEGAAGPDVSSVLEPLHSDARCGALEGTWGQSTADTSTPDSSPNSRAMIVSPHSPYDGRPGRLHDQAWEARNATASRTGELSAHLMEAIGLREEYEHLKYESGRRRQALEWLLRTRDTVPGPYSINLRPRSASPKPGEAALEATSPDGGAPVIKDCFSSVVEPDVVVPSTGPQDWDQGEFWPVKTRDVPKLCEAINKLSSLEGTAAVRLQDQEVFATWRISNARHRLSEERHPRVGGPQVVPRKLMLESKWLKFGQFSKVSFRLFPRGDATAEPGNTTIFVWMEHPPGLSFTFNLRIGENLSTAPRLWQATMIHYRMDLRWSQFSTAFALDEGTDQVMITLQVLQWHGPEENPAESHPEHHTNVSLALEMLQGAASTTAAALASENAMNVPRLHNEAWKL